MECAKIEELLSEYIDGMLDDEMKALVEEHLSTCESCTEVLASLKSLVNELSSFESVGAPKDFLERLHERIEPSFTFGKVIRTLFVPIRIKVPLEFATLAVIAILFFSIWNIQQPKKQIAGLPEDSTPAWREKKGAADTVSTFEAEPYKLKGVVKEETAKPGEKERGTIVLALLLDADVSKRVEAPAPAMEVSPESQERAGMVEEEMVLDSSPAISEVTAPTAAKAGRRKDQLKQVEPAEELELEGRAAAKEEGESSLSRLDLTLSKLRKLVSRVQGKVTSVEYDTETDRPLSILAEIPAKRYPLFLAKLEEIAPIQAPSRGISGEEQEPIQIRIRFISSK